MFGREAVLVTRQFATTSCALVVALVAASCGGSETDSPSAGQLAEPGDASVADQNEPIETVEPVALAFVDTSQGSKMAISVAPNEAGIKWIDMTLDDHDQVSAILVEADDERISIVLEDDRFTMRVENADVVVAGQMGDDAVTIVAEGQMTRVPVDLSFEAPTTNGGELEQGANIGLTPPVQVASYIAGADATSLEYMVDRPLSITGTARIEVSAEATDGPVGFLPIVTQCSGSAAATSVVTSCAPAGDDVIVTVELPIVRDQGRQALKEEHLGIFASRERCEAWAKHVRSIGTLNTVLSAAMIQAIEKVIKNPVLAKAVAFRLKIVAGVMGAAYARSGTVPCGTITVADDLVKDYRDASADFTVEAAITGEHLVNMTTGDGSHDENVTFSTETVSVLPFSASPSASVVLTATRSGTGDETSDEAATDDQAEPARATSGRWSGSGTFVNDSESLSTSYDGEATIELSDGVYSMVYEVISVSTDQGHTGCVTTTTTSGESMATPDENGRLLFEGAADRHILSDCKFYESSGGEVFETTERTVVGLLLEADVISLDLLPATSIEMAWAPL